MLAFHRTISVRKGMIILLFAVFACWVPSVIDRWRYCQDRAAYCELEERKRLDHAEEVSYHYSTIIRGMVLTAGTRINDLDRKRMIKSMINACNRDKQLFYMLAGRFRERKALFQRAAWAPWSLLPPDPKSYEGDPDGDATPELIAPEAVAVAAGNGTAVVYECDAFGFRVPDVELNDALLVPIDVDDLSGVPGATLWKKRVVHLDWVVVTGLIEHAAMKQNYSRTLRGKAGIPIRHIPDYTEIEIERQEFGTDGTWSEWVDISRSRVGTKNASYGMYKVEPESLPDCVRFPNLVEPLPRLLEGTWLDVNPRKLRLNGKCTLESVLIKEIDGYPWEIGEGYHVDASDAPEIMCRVVDYSVEHNTTYRYRLRVRAALVWDRYGRYALMSLSGPWSIATEAIWVP